MKTGRSFIGLRPTRSLLWKLLQQHRVDTILNVPDRHGTTPLHSATFYACEGVVEMLLNKGANVNTTIDDELGDGWTPLHCAAFRGHPNLLQKRLAAGADTEARTHVGGDTALFLAALRRDRKIGRLLIRHGANAFAYRNDGSNIREFVRRCQDEQLLATLPALVYQRLRIIEARCRCISCTRRYNRIGSYRYGVWYPKGSTSFVEGVYITH